MLAFDTALSFSPRVAGGLELEVTNLTQTLQRARAGVTAQVSSGALGFPALVDADTNPVKALAAELWGTYRDLVVLGIGGSSLGGRALIEAVAPGATVHFCDNVDPETFARRLAGFDPDKTAFCVISKSGGTVETAAQFCIVRDRLRRAFGAEGYAARTVCVTDPERGILRELATREGLRTLSVPQNVGGRFSVLSAVGLLPAAFAGIDIDELLRGARDVRDRFVNDRPTENATLIAAAMLHAADSAGRKTHVVMPYCDRLRAFSDWTVQLIAESLGKAHRRDGSAANCGPLPHPAIGTTDQHSQVQLFMEGPADKFVQFIGVEDIETAEALPFPDDLPDAYAFLRGHSMGGLLKAEREGTALALATKGHPSATLMATSINAYTLGALFMHFQLLTAAAGELYDIDAFDQPGVEAGKRIAFAKMGRDGYADALSEFAPFEANTPVPLIVAAPSS